MTLRVRLSTTRVDGRHRTLEGYFIFLRPATVYAIAKRVYTNGANDA